MKLVELAKDLPEDAEIRLKVGGVNQATGQEVEKYVHLPLGPKAGTGAERLERSAGLTLREDAGKVLVDTVVFGGAAEKAKVDFDWEVMHVDLEAERLPKEVFWIPALGLLCIIILVQRRRRKLEEA